MARLDALIPTAGGSASKADASTFAAAATLESATETGDDDPLAQIRAELNAELNAVLGSFDGDDDVALQAIPSDLAEVPSVLEALPVPEAVVEQPVRVVAVETPRAEERKKPERPASTHVTPARRRISDIA